MLTRIRICAHILVFKSVGLASSKYCAGHDAQTGGVIPYWQPVMKNPAGQLVALGHARQLPALEPIPVVEY